MIKRNYFFDNLALLIFIDYYIIGTSKGSKMVGHSVNLSEVRDPTSVWTYAGYRGRLAASTRWSIMGVVVACDFAIGTAAAGGYPGYY